MYTNLYQMSQQDFHENRRRGSRAFLTVVNKITLARRMKPYNI